MERNDALRALRTRWRYIVAGLLVGLALAALLNWSAERRYESTAHFFVDVAPSTAEARDPYGNQQFSAQRVISYVQVLTGRELAQRVVDELALPVSAGELTEMITATPLPDTVVLEVTVTDSSPERAQRIAGSVANQFISRVQQLETPEGAASPAVTVELLEPPTFEAAPVSPAVGRTLALGCALGLLVGIGLALLRDRLDRSVRSDDEATTAGEAPVLGRIPVGRQLTRRHLSSSTTGQSAAVEAFRTLRVNLQHVDLPDHPRAVVVAGALPGDGASTIAVNLAVSLARSGGRVVLVDADMRRPRVARQLGLPAGRGLSDVLTGTAALHEVAQPWGDTTLTVVDAGSLVPDPAAQLASPAMRSLLRDLRNEYDYVIVDSPPLLSVVDGTVLSGLADGCLVVSRFGQTTVDQLAEATSAISRGDADVLGVVLNRVPARTARRRRRYTADTGRGTALRGTPPPRSRPDRDADEGIDGDPDAAPDDAHEAFPITGTLPPPTAGAGRSAKTSTGTASRAPRASPPATT